MSIKVLQIIQRPQLRGAEIFASQLSNQLIEEGVDVKMITLFPGDSILPFKGEVINLDRPISKRLYDFVGWKQLANYIRKEGECVIQANAGDTLKYAAISKYIYGWKQPLVFRNANYISGFINSPLKKWVNYLWIRKCDHVISVSESCRNDFINVFKSHKNRASTVTIGTYDWSNIKASTIKQELNIENEPLFINVGSLVPEKNHAFLIEVFHEFYKRGKTGHLIIVGNGKLSNDLKRQTDRLNLSSRVHFLGYRDDAIELMKASDMLILPSKIEGLPGVILEALSCGIPVIASDVGGISDVIINGENGYCLKEQKIDSFIKAIENLLDNTTILNEFVSNGKQLVEEQFYMDKVSRQFIDIYKKHHNW